MTTPDAAKRLAAAADTARASASLFAGFPPAVGGAAYAPGAVWFNPSGEMRRMVGFRRWRAGRPLAAFLTPERNVELATVRALLQGGWHYAPDGAEAVGAAVTSDAGVAPDLVGAVVGYREWVVHPTSDEPGLTSIGAGRTTWTPGTNTATCVQSTDFLPHVAPAEDCSCGLYAYHEPTLTPVSRSGPLEVVGVIRAWGDMDVHETGFRAQYAEVVAIAAKHRVMVDGENRTEDVMRTLARRYRCEVLPDAKHSTLAKAGERHGGSVNPGLRPQSKRGRLARVAGSVGFNRSLGIFAAIIALWCLYDAGAALMHADWPQFGFQMLLAGINARTVHRCRGGELEWIPRRPRMRWDERPRWL